MHFNEVATERNTSLPSFRQFLQPAGELRNRGILAPLADCSLQLLQGLETAST